MTSRRGRSILGPPLGTTGGGAAGRTFTPGTRMEGGEPAASTPREAALAAENARLRALLDVAGHGPEAGGSVREAHLQAVLDSAVDYAIITTDPLGTVTSWNAGAERISGWSAAEMRGGSAERFFTPEDLAAGRVAAEMRRALDEGRASDERWHMRKDGSRFWASGEMMPLHGEDGSDLGFLKILRDRTGERDARARVATTERALAVAEERRRLAVEATGIGIFDFAPQTGELVWDERTRALFGIGPDDPVSYEATFLAGLHPDDRADADAAVQAALDPTGPGTFDITYRVLPPAGGSTRWIAARGQTVVANGVTARFVGTVRDITARKAAEEAVAATQERYLLVGRATNDAIWDWDLVRDHVLWNEALTTAYGYDLAAIAPTGEWWLDHVHPDDRARVEDDIRGKIAGTGSEWVHEYRFRRADGSYAHVLDRGYMVRGPAGEPIRMIGAMLDLSERKRAEEALRASEEFNRRILQSSSDCIKVLDLDARLEFMSEGGLCIMEVDDFGAIRGACWPDFWTGEGHEMALAAVAQAKAGGTGRFQGFATTMKGSPRWWDVAVTPIVGPDGRPEKLLSVSRDITGAKEAEADLKQAGTLLGAVMNAVPGVVYAKDRAGRMLAANRGTAELVGLPLDAIVGRTDLETLEDKVQAAAVMATDRRIMESGRAEQIEEEVRLADGEPAIWLSMKAPLRDEAGTVVGLVGSSVDITARKRAEAALQRLNETLERRVAERTAERDRLWRASQDLLLVARFDGTIEACNPAWGTTLGWAEDELVGNSFLDIVHPDDRGRTVEGAALLAEGRTIPLFENRFRRKDGAFRWLSWTAAPEGGLIFAVARDVQEAKDRAEALGRAEEQLRQSQKMEAVGQLTGGIAHDFNNLLAGISGSLELMQTRMSQGRIGELDRYMVAAQGAAKRAAALTHRLLAFSRRQTLDPKPTDVNRLVTGMEELVRRTVGPAVEVEVVTAAGLWPALVDAGQLENALLNLCINARDAMPDGGRITIETANKWLDERAARERELAPGQYLSLCVTDTGTGMTPDVIEKAFEPFFTTKPIGQGTGLGLSMIYGFVRQSGGQVRIYSEVDQGTTMCLYLPRHYGEADEADPAPDLGNALPAERGGTVLLVDDEPTVRMLVSEILEEMGYTAIEAADAGAGLKILRSDVRIDLLVTDVGLPGGMNGRQLADAGRSVRPGLKVLFITGYAENAVVGNGHLEPGMQVLTKPFVMDVLAARIRDMIEA